MGAPRPKLMIACPGLDHAARGFETLARECFEALRLEGSLDVTLVKGSGRRAAGELVARTLRRDGAAARSASRLFRKAPYGAYDVEQLGFALKILPLLARRGPHVVYLSDLLTSRGLASWRRLSRAPFKLVVSNGGPWPHEFLRHADHVQELTPPALDSARIAGEPAGRHTLLPLGVAMAPRLDLPSDAEREALRGALGLPTDRRIVLSAGALNLHHKRLDYLIEEFAALPVPRPLLVLLGARDPETRAVQSLAASLLGSSDCVIRTVPSREIRDYYRAADVFVLASLVEAFGRVFVEAMSAGLPCVAHDGPVQRYVLGPHGVFGDLRVSGELRRLLSAHQTRGPAPRAATQRHDFAYRHFSWDALAPRYLRLFERLAAQT